MKKFIVYIVILSILTGNQLQAQQTGDAAANSSRAVKENNWQNWVFASSAIAAAAGAVFVVTMENGLEGQSTFTTHWSH